MRTKYATGTALVRHHGPLHRSNAWMLAHPNAFWPRIWHRREKRVVVPADQRRRPGSGITFLVSDKVPYRGVFLFRPLIAERLQTRLI
jgi:hypothetical protein